MLKKTFPSEFDCIASYFEENYIRVKKSTGRKKAVSLRYDIALWNQYDAVVEGNSRTNNLSEGWHSRFSLILGKNHPSLYTFLDELKKEQNDTETMLRELELGRLVKKSKDKKYIEIDEKIFRIVSKYDEYMQRKENVKYLQIVGCYV